jgi:hypothetical protein
MGLPRRLVPVALCLFASAIPASAQAPEALEFFEKRIRPLLAEHCQKCHGAEKQKGHLRLDSRAAILKGGDSGPALVPGDVAQSRLLKAIDYGDPELRMPPRGKLPDALIEDLTQWVKQGALWPDDAKNQKLTGAKEFDLKARSRHWSLLPLKSSALPAVKNQAWAQTLIDTFILAKLEEKGLAPSPPADPRTLLRRLHFDLIGLPPPARQVEEFAASWDGASAKRQALVERLVEQLLASPQYGERWARHWLDLVRYAETHGHEFDVDIPDAWQYRDYVIRAFHDDVPYDQFVREHIAGDLLPKPRRNPTTKTNESILGTGFWWLGEAKHSPVDSRADQADRIDNQIDVFGKAFLGMTIACARCHDHKFDAISTKDYYALAGYLQSVRPDHAFLDPAEQRQRQLEPLRNARAAIAALLPRQHFVEPQLDPGAGVLFAHFSKGDFGAWTVTGDAFGDRPSSAGDMLIRPDRPNEPIKAVPPGLAHSGLMSTRLQGTLRSPTFTIQHKRIHYRVAGKQAQVRLVLNGLQLIQEPIYGGLKFGVDDETPRWHTQDVTMWQGQRAYIEVLDHGPGYAALEQVVFSDESRPPSEARGLVNKLPLITDDNRAQVMPLLEEFRKAEAALASPHRALASADGTGVNECVFIRGNSKNLGEVVPRRFLEVFGGCERLPPTSGSGRLQLAEQMLDPAKTPLLPRVLVNRVWQHYFGAGIVRSPDDFGALGQAPTHPELLDYLATEFVKNGWSLKKLHKMIVLSATYQQASSPKMSNAVLGGAPQSIDPENRLLWKMPVRRLEAEAIRDALLAVSGRLDPTVGGPSVPVHLTPFMVGRGRPGMSGPLDGNGRRSIYIAVRRNFLTPMFVAFDYPTPFSTMGRRSVSNVPAQALTMLNNPLVVQQAELWAKKVLAELGLTGEQRVRKMYETSLSRPPTTPELAAALAFMQEQARAYGREDDARAWADFAHVLFNLKEFIFVN